MTDWLGYVAATLTTAAFIPQVVKSLRSQSVNDLSLAMLVAFNIGVACWLAYGFLIGAVPLIAANAATLACSLILLVLKIKARPE
jgi:MtN3 and saliva related transmembrane protein